MIFLYVLMLAASLLFYIQFEGPFSFYLFAFVLMYPIVFGIISFYIKKKLRVGFELSEINASKGDKVPVKIIVDNPTIFPVPNCDIAVRYCSEINSMAEIFKIHTPIFPKSKQELTVCVSYTHYGSVSLRITNIKIFDMLRVIKLKVKPKKMILSSMITVYPGHIPIESNISDYSELGLESDGYSKNKKGDDPSEVFDIHEYNEGDKISRIHWKLSAKQDELMVKDYSLPITNGILIALDTAATNSKVIDPDKYDSIIDSAAAISLRLSENEVTHTVIWSSDNSDGFSKEKITDVDDYMVMIVKLIKNRCSGTVPITSTICDISEGERRFAHIIVCTAAFDSEDRTKLTGSNLSYKYTVLDAAGKGSEDYTDGDLTYMTIDSKTVAEKLDEITL